jgi:hypothetical protein
MSTRTAQQPVASAFTPNWTAEALAAAMPRALSLRDFEFQPPANAAALHRPRRSDRGYVVQAALPLFRVR